MQRVPTTKEAITVNAKQAFSELVSHAYKVRGRNENRLFTHLSMEYRFLLFSSKWINHFSQLSMKMKDNENTKFSKKLKL